MVAAASAGMTMGGTIQRVMSRLSFQSVRTMLPAARVTGSKQPCFLFSNPVSHLRRCATIILQRLHRERVGAWIAFI